MNKPSITDTVKSIFTDLSEEHALLLTQRTVAWISILGSTTVARIQEAIDRSDTAGIEERAIILATSVISRLISEKYQSEVERLDSMATWLLTIQNEDVTPV